MGVVARSAAGRSADGEGTGGTVIGNIGDYVAVGRVAHINGKLGGIGRKTAGRTSYGTNQVGGGRGVERIGGIGSTRNSGVRAARGSGTSPLIRNTAAGGISIDAEVGGTTGTDRTRRAGNKPGRRNAGTGSEDEGEAEDRGSGWPHCRSKSFGV